MKLTYRGNEYDYKAPTVEYGDTIASGKYRGLDIRFRNPQKTPVYPSTLGLRYRGATTNPEGTTSTPVDQPAQAPVFAATVASTVDTWARTLMTDQSRAIKRRQQDMLSRLAVEVGVPSDEIERDWSKIQGKLHPTFRSNYGRSSAAMS